MRILVTNDDGIFAPGLWALAEAVADLAEVWVVAPDRELSGVGTGVTYLQPLRVQELPTTPVEGVRAFAVQGTPSDCVIMALGALVQEVDCVFSGINAGANMGNDVLLSGTVGGALQGYFYGHPSFALSVASVREPKFAAGARLGRFLAEQVAEGVLSGALLLNANLPNLPWEELRGVELTRLAQRQYADKVEETKDTWGRPQYWLRRGQPEWLVEEGTDIWALRQGKLSLTCLHSDLSLGHHHDGVGQVPHAMRPLLTPPDLLPPYDPPFQRRNAGTQEGGASETPPS